MEQSMFKKMFNRLINRRKNLQFSKKKIMSFFVLTNEKPEFMAQFVHSSRTGAFVANNRFIYRNDAIMMNMKVYS